MRRLAAVFLTVVSLAAPAAAADLDQLLALEDWRGDPWVARN